MQNRLYVDVANVKVVDGMAIQTSVMLGALYIQCLSSFLTILLLQEVAQECQGMNWGTFKSVLTDALVDHLHPIQV